MNNFRLKEEKARFAREEAAELERKLAPAKAELAATLQRADKMTKAYWIQSLSHLAGLIASGSFEPDHGVTYPSTDEQQSGSRGRDQFQEFVTVTLPRRGFVLSEAGSQRLLYFVLAQAFSENRADLANPETWKIAFDRLYSLQCFDETANAPEIGYDESQRIVEPVIEQPAPEPDIEKIDTSTREGAAKARAIVAKAVFGPHGEARVVFNNFRSHCRKVFGIDLDVQQQKEIVNWFVSNRRSFLSNSWDEMRVNLVRRRILPQSCLTEEEILANSIEDEDTTSYQGRRNLKQEIIASRNRN